MEPFPTQDFLEGTMEGFTKMFDPVVSVLFFFILGFVIFKIMYLLYRHMKGKKGADFF